MTAIALPRTRFLFLLGVFILAVLWTLASRASPSEIAAGDQPPSPQEGFSAPDFTLTTLAGESLTLSDLRGKVVLLNFWASWCLPCKAEMPALQHAYIDYRDLGLEIVAVNTTYQDTEQNARAFVEEFQLTFPIPMDLDGSVSDKYTLHGLPTTFFIDRQGQIQKVVVGGPMSEALIRSQVEDLLKEDG
jgi:peroxiredoxin